MLWEYCEELKRTNVKTIAQVEGYAGEFKRIYICLGPLKDGFVRCCGRVIGVDGCFLKTEHGRQLLTAFDVDGNNGMYPLAYIVVEVENGDNLEWFLGLLKDDLQMHNSHVGHLFLISKWAWLVQLSHYSSIQSIGLVLDTFTKISVHLIKEWL
ncbi:Uncharacterized protein Adt_20093 [Abeliophyllum distichum]|uniref:MULE transposase domain-containing protein n=1 Tax=Abeliophyllum distichum TaxID=126358 RepID=A0ABD1SVQ9_9LAMI